MTPRKLFPLLVLTAGLSACASSPRASRPADCGTGNHRTGGDTTPCLPDDASPTTSPAPASGGQPTTGTSQASKGTHSPSKGGLPDAVMRACGHPSSNVVLTVNDLKVHRAACDLTGVTLMHDGGGSVVVPSRRGVTSVSHFKGPAGSSNTTVGVDKNGDVSFAFRRG